MVLLLTVVIGEQNNANAKNNPKYASLVMDADTGLIISQRYADAPRYPASLTKMMTLLLTFEALENRQLGLGTRVRISRHAASMVPSKLNLPVGSTIRVKDAIYALVTKSANDVAVALAERIAGSEGRFARLMTRRARDIGMRNTVFKNASGLHNKRQITTARDMATLGRYILMRYPNYYRYFSKASFSYRGKTYRNHNHLMKTYAGMDGFKTGYISASGFNLVASAQRGGRRLIGVVFGGRSSKTRNAHMKEILDKGFARVGRVRMAHAKNTPLPQRKPPVITASANQKIFPTSVLKADKKPTEKNYTSLEGLPTPKEKVKIASRLSPTEAHRQAVRARLNQTLDSTSFRELIGEGDYDSSVSKRFETGLLAMAVHTGKYKPSPAPTSAAQKSVYEARHALINKMATSSAPNAKASAGSIAPTGKTAVSFTTPTTAPSASIAPATPYVQDNLWAVQIGAFQSRVATDMALKQAKARLPRDLQAKASPLSVPLQRGDDILFRARLTGLTKREAEKSCRYFTGCLLIAP